MVWATPADWATARWLLFNSPNNDETLMDACGLVITACQHHWQVDPAALDVVRQAAVPLDRPALGDDAAVDAPANDH